MSKRFHWSTKGLYDQVMSVRKASIEPLTLEILEQYLNELMMSKRNKKSVVQEVKQPSEETIKAVFELYKPNKFQLFFLKAFGPADTSVFTGNKARVLQISNVLNISEEEVRQLEMTQYLGWKVKS
jgi:hypothetical protein